VRAEVRAEDRKEVIEMMRAEAVARVWIRMRAEVRVGNERRGEERSQSRNK
jgi:hypothetical protein